jgi:hypothetical protein
MEISSIIPDAPWYHPQYVRRQRAEMPTQPLLSDGSLVELVIGCVLPCCTNAVESGGNFLVKHPPGAKAGALRELFPSFLRKKVTEPIVMVVGFSFRPLEGGANNFRRLSIVGEQVAFMEEERGHVWQTCGFAHLHKTAVGFRVYSRFDGWHNIGPHIIT